MKYRMLSLLSIILALSIKSLDISAKDYYELRVLVNAIPPDPYAPHLIPYALDNKLDSIVFRIAQNNFVNEAFGIPNDSVSEDINVFSDLQNEATEEQLNELMVHTSPLVKVYAYRALVMNNMNMNCEYELSLLKDTSCVGLYTNNAIINSTVKELVQADLTAFR